MAWSYNKNSGAHVSLDVFQPGGWFFCLVCFFCGSIAFTRDGRPEGDW